VFYKIRPRLRGDWVLLLRGVLTPHHPPAYTPGCHSSTCAVSCESSNSLE